MKKINQFILALTLSVISITTYAQCPNITNLTTTLGANGTASVVPVISGTVSPAMTMYYWQISPSGVLNSTQFQSQGEMQFYSNGTYTVCLNFSDSLNNCWSNQYCTTITISNLPAASCHADFTAYSDSNCVTYFNNTSTGNNITYDWLINGNHYASVNPSVNLPNGNYSVLLQTYYAGQPCDSISHNVNVACSGNNTVTCQANFTYSTDTSCVTHITNTSIGNNLTYEWYDITNPNNIILASTAANPSLNLSQGYNALQMASFSNGTFCDSVTQVIYVNCANPVGNCQAYSQFIVFPDSVNTTSGNYYAYNTSYGTGNVSYLWDFGDGSTSSQQYPFHQYAVPGQYIICLTVNATYSNAIGSATCTDTYCDSSSVQRMASGFLMSQMNVIPQTAAGIKQTEVLTQLNTYPNPVSDELTIEAITKDNSKLNYRLIDALGRVVLSGTIENSKTTINASSLEKGFYSLRITNEKGNSLKAVKLVK
ncbi:MAG: T9SS type A sorting domain-containing protein [Bacteroidia bacterium]|nr:T9SS type A sorting domain-containing protein [Bacteroidia bacterium]